MSKTNQIVKFQQELVHYHPQFFAEIKAKIESHVDQIINILNKEEEALQCKLVANPDGHYIMEVTTPMGKSIN